MSSGVDKSAPKKKRKDDGDSLAASTKKPRQLEKVPMNAIEARDSKASAVSETETSSATSVNAKNEYITPPRTEDYENEGLRNEWKEKVDMTPPSNKLSTSGEESSITPSPYLSVAEVENRMRRDNMEQFLIPTDGVTATVEQRIIYYLYGSGYAWDDNEKRVNRVLKFLAGPAKNRMLDIIRNDHDHIGNLALHAHWLKNQKSVLRYEQQDDAKTIFSKKRFPYVSRLQSSKNCYLHAASAIIGYKVAFGQTESNLKAASVDVSRLVRHSFHDAKLEGRVIDNKGGSSISLLRELLQGSQCNLKAIPLMKGVGGLEEVVIQCIDLHGPALVRRFKVDTFFRNKCSEKADNQESSQVFIHQFDRVDELDAHAFLSLGESTKEELQTVQQLGDANPPPPEDDSIISSSSTETTESSSQGFSDQVEDDEETKDGLHAMVAIGYRIENSDTGQKKYWFLLQNTWRKMPLLEVSAEYLKHHLSLVDGQIVFVEGNLEAIPTTLGICHGLYVEALLDDGGEIEEEAEDDGLLEEN